MPSLNDLFKSIEMGFKMDLENFMTNSIVTLSLLGFNAFIKDSISFSVQLIVGRELLVSFS